MGRIRDVAEVKLFCGIIVSDCDLLPRVTSLLSDAFGPIEDKTADIPFTHTDYYTEEMGASLIRRFVSFSRLISPGDIAHVKCETNGLENLFRESGQRRVNLDPGYVAPSKLVLATTKDFSHRIYLQDGIYAEITLGFNKQGMRPFEWTYPDFLSPDYRDFFLRVRKTVLAAP